MRPILRLLLLTLAALLLQVAPAWAQAKEAPSSKGPVVRLLKTDTASPERCMARYALLTSWEETEVQTASNTLQGLLGDEERAEMQAPCIELPSPSPSALAPSPWLAALLPDPALPVRLRPPIAAAH